MPYNFKFIVNNKTKFSDQLKTKRCSHIDKNHKQCKREVTIGAPLCWQHLATDSNLKIKKSTIPNGGKGLFAYNGTQNHDTVFKTNKIIYDYIGEKLKKQQLDARYGKYTAPYAVAHSNGLLIDSALDRGVGSLINSVARTHREPNVDLIDGANNNIRVKALKNIKNNTELLTRYGKDYKLQQKGVKVVTRRPHRRVNDS